MAKTEEIELNVTNFSLFYHVVELFDCFVAIYLSIRLLGDPVAGVCVAMLFGFLTAFAKLSLRGRGAYLRKSTKVVMAFLFFFLLGLNIVTVVFFRDLLNRKGLLLGMFVLITAARTIATDALSCSMGKRSFRARLWLLIVLHLLFVLLFGAVALMILREEAWTAILSETAISIALLTKQTRTPRVIRTISPEKLGSVYSFKLYRNTAFYCYLAVFTSAFIYLFYMFSQPMTDPDEVFAVVALWLVVMGGFTYFVYRLIPRVRRSLGMGIFLLGALVWTVSAFLLFRSGNTIARGWWSLLWAGGSGCMFAVSSEFQRRFKAVSPLIDFEISDDALMQNTVEMQTLAFMIAEALVLSLVLLWAWFSPELNTLYNAIASSALTLLPVLFLIVSMIMAARQPMEDRYNDRLEKVGRGDASEELKASLDKTLVKKHKKKYGVRIIMALLRLILHHKVYGKNHVDESRPSIFVCNHGEIYGPVVSVVYLPFHFRPWIESRMLDEQIYDFMYRGTYEPIKWMPKCMKKFCNRISGKFLIWALNSFDPIPVHKDSLREVIKTMNESVEALKADDNILLFPENPESNEDGRYGDRAIASSFYTGFAHIAVQYYKETGKCAVFYPVYADKRRKTYSIGEGIVYDPDRSAAEEKRRIAEELHEAMCAMIAENDSDEDGSEEKKDS